MRLWERQSFQVGVPLLGNDERLVWQVCSVFVEIFVVIANNCLTPPVVSFGRKVYSHYGLSPDSGVNNINIKKISDLEETSIAKKNSKNK